MKRILSTVLAGLLVSSSVAFAAQSVAVVQGVGGKVLVNKGEGFVPVVGSMSVVAGDTVMVGDESSATLAYGECSVVLEKPTVFAVTESAPCGKANGVFVSPTADVPQDVTAPWPLLFLIGGGAIATTAIIIGTKDKKGGVSAP